MTFQLVCIEPKELTQYKADMQEAFQKGFEDAFGKTDAVKIGRASCRERV